MCHHRLIKFLFKGIDLQVFIPIFIYLLPQESKHRYSGVILLQYKYDFGREVFSQISLSHVHTHIPLFTTHGVHKALISIPIQTLNFSGGKKTIMNWVQIQTMTPLRHIEKEKVVH
jgi:hypothetical protein